MSWIDRPIEKITRRKTTSAERMQLMRHRQSVLADTAEIERRRREYLERQRPPENNIPGRHLTTRVLVDWHVDEHGCLARAVGCEA